MCRRGEAVEEHEGLSPEPDGGAVGGDGEWKTEASFSSIEDMMSRLRFCGEEGE